MKKNIKKPNAILFVCNINSIRSPMAEAITIKWFDRKIFVDSCGIRFGKIDYLAVEVMAEKKLNYFRFDNYFYKRSLSICFIIDKNSILCCRIF